MDKKLKSLKSKIEKLDREILRTSAKLDRAIKSHDLMEVENPNLPRITLSVAVSRDNVRFFTNYLSNLEEQKEILIKNYCNIAQEKENTLLEGPDGEFNSQKEEILFLEMKNEDYESLIFAYTCLISATQVKITLAIKDEGVVSEETKKEQEYLTFLQGKLAVLQSYQQVIQARLSDVKGVQEKDF